MGVLLEDGKANRDTFISKLVMPVLVLNGDRSIAKEQTLGCVQRIAEHIQADLVPNSAHLLGEDNPAWVAERLANSLYRAAMKMLGPQELGATR